MTNTPRPPFIVSSGDVAEEAGRYPDSAEALSYGRAIGAAAGLVRIGVHVERLPPGTRTSWPHAHEREEELVFVLAGEVDAWIDGALHRLRRHDLAAFPAGTGIAHTILNDGPGEALLLVVGEHKLPGERGAYPLHPAHQATLGARNWHDAPARPLGAHDGVPRRAPPTPARDAVVRSVAPDEAEAWRALRLRGLQECPRAFGGSHEEESARPVDLTRARLAAQAPDQAVVLGAYVDGALVGTIGVRREDGLKARHKAAVWGMYVAPEGRGRGIGGALLDAGIACARAMGGVTHMKLGVVVGQHAARALYTSRGFVPWGTEPASLCVDGVLVDDEFMTLAL